MFIIAVCYYACVVREKVFVKKPESDVADNANAAVKSPTEEQKMAKEITELSKMRNSGTAAIVLRDLRRKRSESPTLDPRNACLLYTSPSPRD